MDVKVEEMNGAMDNIYATTIDQSEVTNLLQEMKDAHGMEIGDGVRLKKMKREAPSYLTSCGLALRRFLQ